MAWMSGAKHVGLLWTGALLLGLGASPMACGGAPPKQAGEDNNFDEKPDNSMPSKWEGASNEQKAATTDTSGLSEDQKKQMDIALRRGTDKASHCGEVVPDAPTGEGEVHVIMDGKKGRITDVTVGSPWAGTGAEACIKRAFIGEVIMPFDGEPRDVAHSIKVEKKGAAQKSGDKAADKSTDKKKP